MDSYTKELDINVAVEKVYQALTTKEGLEGWWTKCELEDNVWTFHFDEDFTKMQIEKLESNREVVWKCVDHQFSIAGVLPNEWVGTTMHFVLDDKEGKTVLHFTHEGLTSELGCYETCFAGWNHFLNSLKNYIENGVGQPY